MIGQTDVSTYKPALAYHPLANLFPMIEGPERVAFRQSIRDNGLRHPLVMHEGMVLDGSAGDLLLRLMHLAGRQQGKQQPGL